MTESQRFAEAPYVGARRRNKCGHPVDRDDSSDVASLPLAPGGAEHDLRCGK